MFIKESVILKNGLMMLMSEFINLANKILMMKLNDNDNPIST